MLTCSKAAKIDLIDLQTGHSRLPEPIPVQPGSRFAGSVADTAYAYGPTAVYAFRTRTRADDVTAKPGLLWHVAAAPFAETAGDPEFLTRLVAACATPAGVLLVRNDGHIAELNYADGSPRWRHKLTRIANPSLHVCDASAVLLWKHGSTISVAFFNLRSDVPPPRVVTIGDQTPIWTELIPEGLLAVWPKRMRLIAPDSARPSIPLPDATLPTATTLAVYSPPQTTTPRAGVAARLLVEDVDENVCAVDVVTGACELWRLSDVRAPRERRAREASLRITNDVVIRTRTDFRFNTISGCAEFYDPAKRITLARLERSVTLAATTRDGFAYGVFRPGLSSADMREALRAHEGTDEQLRQMLTDLVSDRNEPQAIRLVRQIMIDKPWPRPDEPVDPGPREYSLGHAAHVRDVFWVDDKFVLVEDNRLRAYTLP